MWPLSRESYPKQFLRLYGEHSLFQMAVLRAADRRVFTRPIIVCNEEYRFRIAEHLRQISVHDALILLEPVSKNTAPAISAAVFAAMQTEDNPILMVLAADHIIEDQVAFVKAARAAESLAHEGHLVAFGVKPQHPATGYGYIHLGKKCGAGYEVASFKEKPKLALAKKFLQKGNYYWNCGMFAFTARTYLEELRTYAPEIARHAAKAIEHSRKESDFTWLNASSFGKCTSTSIDYALMERTKRAVMVKLPGSWSDVGSWSSLWEVTERDRNGNKALGDVIAKNTKSSYLRAESKLLVALGLKDIIVVDTKDATLVASKKHAEGVKDIVAQLKAQKRQEYICHRKEYRPWGAFESLDFEKNFQVKRITVNPGGTLSLQKHNRRAEHWVVVSGTAKVTRGAEVLQLRANESTFIPKGINHRLENNGNELLEVVEVQTGDYFGEDDIIRYDDKYGRKKSDAK